MSRKAPKFAQFSLMITMFFSVHNASGFGGGGGGYKYYTTKKSKCLNPPRTARRVENFISECQEEVKNKLVNEAYQILKEEAALKHPKVVESSDYAFDLIENMQTHHQIQIKPANDDKWPNDVWLPTTVPPATAESPTDQHQYYEPKVPQQPTDFVDITTSTPESQNVHEHETSRKKRVARLMHRIRRIGDISQGVSVYHPTLVPYEDKRIAGCLLHCVYAKNNAIDKYGWPTLDGLVDFYSEGVNEHGFFMATLRSVNLCLRAVTNKYKIDRRKLPEHGESCDVAFDVFDCISDQITGYCLDQYQ